MKHTPGPWKIHKLDLINSRFGFSIYHNGPIAYSAPQGDLPNGHDAEANARLIAAAPDLLDAAKECLPDLKHYVSTHGPGPDKRLANLINAVAKAEERG